MEKLTANDDSVEWAEYRADIIQYINKGLSTKYSELTALSKSQLVGENLKYYRRYIIKRSIRMIKVGQSIHYYFVYILLGADNQYDKLI